jgi:trans-aconitate methyltransferase
MKRQTDDPTYAARMQAMYDRTDEKPVLKAHLTQVLGKRRFSHALDVGPGPGELTEVLHQHSDRLTLVEITPSFEPVLKRRFPAARVVIDSIGTFDLKQEFDAILYSQGLYYQPESEWFSICKRLYDSLLTGGELILIMNTDSGDYWKTIDHFWALSAELKTFYYRPWSQFRKELSRLGEMKVTPVSYGADFSQDEIDDYMGGGLLALLDSEVEAKYRARIHEFSQQFLRPDGRYVMKIDCEIVTLKKS